MKTLISAPNVEDYLKYVKYIKFNPNEVFYFSTPEEAEKNRVLNENQGIPSQTINLTQEDIDNIPK